MMCAPFTLAEELRFLGLQCLAQANGAHRDQDREFISTLIARIFEFSPNLSLIFARLLLPAADLEGANQPALLRTAGRDLAALAMLLDREAEGRAA